MKFVNGKKMEESDLCMMLEDLGVVLDKSTWTHFKDAFAQSKPETKPSILRTSLKGYLIEKNWIFWKNVALENVPSNGPSSSKAGATEVDTQSGDNMLNYG